MDVPPRPARAVWSAVFAAGLCATLAQILILRELLVLFQGNELSTGLVLAVWLLLTGGGSGLAGLAERRISSPLGWLAGGLVLLALLLPVTLMWIRAAGPVWGIGHGEMLSPPSMLLIAISSTILLCPLGGALFTLAWSDAARSKTAEESDPIFVYLAEAGGAGAAGMVFNFLLLPHFSTTTTALIGSAVSLAGAAPLLFAVPQNGRCLLRVLWTAGALAILTGFWFSADADSASLRLRWGDGLVESRNTPYHNLALLQKEEQYSLFANGLWLFSVPDRQSAERAVHFALLEHPDPVRVLLIGGGVAGLTDQVFRHPSVKRQDYVEPDPEVIRIVRNHLPAALHAGLDRRGLKVHHRDAASFVREAGSSYDVVIMNVGDPVNAGQNRFYTKEFFGRVQAALKPGGVFSFGVAGADILGPAQARYLRSIHATLTAVFLDVLVFPGETVRFFAATEKTVLTSDVGELAARIRDRGLDLRYVREYYLFDALNPMRLDYIRSILETDRPVPVNENFRPICYRNNLALWFTQLDPSWKNRLAGAGEVSGGTLKAGLAVFGVLAVLALRLAPGGAAAPAAAGVFCVGLIGLVVEMVLILAFQILEGFVYEQLAFIVSFFMAGLAFGAGAFALAGKRTANALPLLVATQTAICVALAFVLLILRGYNATLRAGGEPAAVGPVFSLLALGTGFLGGLFFALALRVSAGSSIASGRRAGLFYGLDLAGSAAGAVLASLWLLPVYGVQVTLELLLGIGFLGLLGLIPVGKGVR